MHFEILVEGQTELTTLSILLPKIIGEYNKPHTWKIHKHQGVGRLPDDFNASPRVQDRSLLHNFPSKLKAYSKSMTDKEMVILLLDLDEKEDCIAYKKQILSVLETCDKRPKLLVRFAIEELESWFLGDIEALRKSFSKPKLHLLKNYQQDSVCGTWELLADIVHIGGYAQLKEYGKRSRRILEEKRIWATKIAPNMNVEKNASYSFNCFKDGLIRNLN